jgi:uncharacterized protein
MLHVVAFVLAMVGAVNWGLIGLFNLNIVEWVLGTSMLTQLVYILVGASAVYLFFTHSQDCRTCNPTSKKTK